LLSQEAGLEGEARRPAPGTQAHIQKIGIAWCALPEARKPLSGARQTFVQAGVDRNVRLELLGAQLFQALPALRQVGPITLLAPCHLRLVGAALLNIFVDRIEIIVEQRDNRDNTDNDCHEITQLQVHGCHTEAGLEEPSDHHCELAQDQNNDNTDDYRDHNSRQ
jgi:hypothetical protein